MIIDAPIVRQKMPRRSPFFPIGASCIRDGYATAIAMILSAPSSNFSGSVRSSTSDSSKPTETQAPADGAIDFSTHETVQLL